MWRALRAVGGLVLSHPGVKTFCHAVLNRFPVLRFKLCVLMKSGGRFVPPLPDPAPRTGSQRYFFIDVGGMPFFDAHTGIQRVVHDMTRQFVIDPPRGYEVRLVYPYPPLGTYVYAQRYASEAFRYDMGYVHDRPISHRRGDVLLGIDLQTYAAEFLDHAFDALRQDGVKVYCTVHDIIPILHPEFPNPNRDLFPRWLEAVLKADGVFCVSDSVAGDVDRWRSGHRPDLRPAILSNRPGADFAVRTFGLPDDAEEVLRALGARPSFLVVSTIEPRKGHRQALDAFELLWARNVDVNLVLVGRQGWGVRRLVERISSHPRLGGRLFWLQGISDEYLTKTYDACTAVLFPSHAEGFGLAVVEGAYHGKPLILRDIPVFREIAGAHAWYFSGRDGVDLAASLEAWLEARASGTVPSPEGIRIPTWRESALTLLEKMNKHIGNDRYV